MRVLFIHPNFPAQFRHVAAALGRDPGNRVVFATKNERPEWTIPGVTKALYTPSGKTSDQVHALAAPVDTAVREGEAVYRLCKKLKDQGFVPDLVYAHSGWGTTYYLKDVFPDVPLLCYFEWFYDPDGADANFDNKGTPGERNPSLLRIRNAPIANDLWTCQQGFCPTRWQYAQFPREFRYKLDVMHDGVDTNYFRPDPEAAIVLDGLDLSGKKEIVTYTARGMEPYRGFPQFMEAAAMVLERRPEAHVVVAGSERVCYGTPPKDGRSWKDIMLEKLDPDMSRLHFTGSLPYGQYLKVLQASHAHVYLTRPFVLSWSSVEAMACGCQVVGSDTPPVRELIQDGVNGLFTDFHDPKAIADSVCSALEDKDRAGRLRAAARQTALERYSLQKLLPRHLRLMSVTAGRGSGRSKAPARTRGAAPASGEGG